MYIEALVAIGVCSRLFRESFSAPVRNSPSYHLPAIGTRLRLKIHKLDNGTYLASVISEEYANGTANDTSDVVAPYDLDPTGEGAVYYVVAVILMYGFSIILMIGSSVRKNKQDHQAQKYMKEMQKVRRLERRQEKFRTRVAIRDKRIQHILATSGGAGSVSDDKSEAGDSSTQSQSNIATVSTTPGGSGWSLGFKEVEGEAAEPLLLLTDASCSSSPNPAKSGTEGNMPEVKFSLAPVGLSGTGILPDPFSDDGAGDSCPGYPLFGASATPGDTLRKDSVGAPLETLPEIPEEEMQFEDGFV